MTHCIEDNGRHAGLKIRKAGNKSEKKQMKYIRILLVGLVLMITFASFIPCLGNDFTNWDDNHMVSANKTIVSLTVKNIAAIFSSRFVGTYIPLTILSYAVEYHFFKLQPRVYHITNLILHMLNTGLVFLLMYLLTGNFTIAIVVSVLFGIHPLHVESVAWITERKDVLFSFFYLTSLILFMQYRKRRAGYFYAASLLLFIFSLLSKPMAVTLPFVLFLLDYHQRIKLSRALVFEKIPFIALSVILGIVNILTQESLQLPLVKYLQHFFIACRNYLYYPVKLALPFNLSCLYPYPAALTKTIPFDFLLSPLIVAAIAVLVYLTKKFTRSIIFGSLFFVITILPVIQLIPLIASAITADRYTYLPSVGIFYVIGSAYFWLYDKKSGFPLPVKTTLTFFIVLIVVGLSVLTFQRCKVWKNSLTLWNDVLKKYPDNAVAYNNRGRAYDTAGDHDKAIADFNKAIAIDSLDELFYYNRGVSYSQSKNYEKAIVDLDRAISIDTNLAIAYESRGSVNMNLGEFDMALKDINKALEIAPNLAEAYYDRGYLLFKMNNLSMALVNLNKALEIDPQFAVAFLNRGDIYFFYGDYNRAISDYTSALCYDSTLVDAHYNRAVAYSRIGEFERSLMGYNLVLELDSSYAQAYNNRANIYVDMGKYDDAIYDYNQALRLNTGYAEAYYNRCVAYFLTGQFHLALLDISKAKDLGFEINAELIKALRDSLQKH